MKYEVRCSYCDAHLFYGYADTGIDAKVMANPCECDTTVHMGVDTYVTTLWGTTIPCVA